MVKQGFKNTEIGEIPEDWEVYCIRDLINLLTDYDANGSFSSVAENVNTYDYEEYAWYVRSTDLENHSKLSKVKYVDISSYRFLKKTALHGGELLFLKRGDIGNVYLFQMRTKRATLAPNLYLLKLNSVSSSEYLYQYFISNLGQKQLKSKNASSTLGALYKDDVKSIRVPLPRLPEQKAIAEALSDTDAWIENLEQLMAKKRLIKQGAMQQLLTPKEDWEVKKLGEVIEINSGVSPSLLKFENIGTPYLKVDELNNSEKYTKNYKYFISDARSVSKGSIIFPKRGASIFLNKIRILSEDSYMDTNLMTLTVFENYYNEFVYYALKHFGLDSIADTTSIPQINNKHIIPLEISFPSFVEQTRIATILSDMDTELEGLENTLGKAKQIKQGMMQELLTGRVRLV